MIISNPLVKSIPIANAQTHEVLQENLPIPTDRPYSTASTKQPYTELVLYSFNPTNEGTYTQIVAADFALTYITLHLEGILGGTKTNQIYLNGVEIAEIVTIDQQVIDQVLNFPSTIIRKGSELKLVATETGGPHVLRCLHNFIGYQF